MLRALAVTTTALTLLFTGLLAGCDDDGGTTDPPVGGAGGEAAAGGSGGSVGGQEPAPDRGDPSEFPTECLETCAEACAQVASCGGHGDSGFPIEEGDCLQRCELAAGGMHWPDLSGNFKCCATQESCEDVASCGGWLKHPDAAASCGRYCECRFAGAAAGLTEGRTPPSGYRFAPDVLMIDPGPSNVELSEVDGVEPIRAGKRPLVQLGPHTDQATVTELARYGRVLPTFVDAAGRISAATGDVVLVVEQPAALAPALSAAGRYGLHSPRGLKTKLATEPGAKLYLLRGTDAWRSVDALAELASVRGVRAELDQLRYYEKRYTPDDPRYDDQWHLYNVGQNHSTASVDGRVSEAWDVTLGDPQVIIAVNDDGVDLDHPDFAGKLEAELNYPGDWQTQMAQGAFGGHGTSVAGVAAALADNQFGGAGVCPGCRILPHLLGDTTNFGFQLTDAEVAQGFENIVDAGAWVINNSWGYETGNPVYAVPSDPVPSLASVVRAAFDYAESDGRGGLGTVIIFAAGNSNDVLDPYSAYESIVAVASVDDLGLKANYSSFGPENDIAAPSSGGLNGIVTTSAGSSYTDNFGGTSSAAPFVVGVVGLIFSADPTLSAKELRDVLGSTATKIDPVFGAWDEQGHSDFHGAGLVNASAAVQLAAGHCATAAECLAPSDDCGASCGTLTQCEVCRTHADCAADHVCQALPSLGRLVCVAAKGAGSCPGGTVEQNDYCLPTPATCGSCSVTEACNGRDDNCDGQVDEGSACTGNAMCFIDGPGCGTDMVCAGGRCVDSCSEDDDCGNNQTCELLKDQYGYKHGERACASSGGMSGWCELICEMRISSLEDEALAEFVTCMEDGVADCSVTDTCRELFPQDR